ncbi:MAG: hypothetical protein SynsKO_37100 [Synoicihabitans sp.]
MLNELSLLVDAIDRMGAKPTSRHPRINPMGKNKDTLVICLNSIGIPSTLESMSGADAGELFRVEHGAAGSSFPGFNLPAPLRTLQKVSNEVLVPLVESFLNLTKEKTADWNSVRAAINALYDVSAPCAPTPRQEKQFQLSCQLLVTELGEQLKTPPPKLINLRNLITVVQSAKPTLADFANHVGQLIVTENTGLTRADLPLIHSLLFGVLDWKKRSASIGSPAYWVGKAKQDKAANQPVYLDLVAPDTQAPRVAHRSTSKLLNEALIQADANVEQTVKSGENSATSDSLLGVDAFSGEVTKLQDKYPSPKIAELGPLMLFSVNSKEVGALRRYGLGGSATFPASAALVQRMNDGLLFLAKEDRRGKSCRAIPGAKNGKKDLLVVYLENDSEANESAATTDEDPDYAEMFGGMTNEFSDADFVAKAQNALSLLEGKIKENPDLRLRLVAFASIDPGRKQASFNRVLKVADVRSSCKDWEAGLDDLPPITIRSWDKASKTTLHHKPRVPTPLDLASTINRVWSRDSKLGYSYHSHRAFTATDAYDVFVPDKTRVTNEKASFALSLLVARMSPVLTTLGAIKTTRKWSDLSDTVRLQSLKTVSLFNILLRKIDRSQLTRSSAMKEPLYQLGQMLALADSLHQQYCKHVRDGQMPSQLIGNAVFSTALEQPVFALARLSERIVPYQAWAKTFTPSDPKTKSGWEKVLLGKLRECSSRFVEDVNGTLHIRTDEFPERMSDAHKAKLLLGYLADTYEPKETA